MTSAAQRLPVELIDLIIKHVQINSVDDVLMDNYALKNSGGHVIGNNQDLINLSQTCKLFRQRTLPFLWGDLLLQFHYEQSKNKFLLRLPNRFQSFTQYALYYKLKLKVLHSTEDQSYWNVTKTGQYVNGYKMTKKRQAKELFERIIRAMSVETFQGIQFVGKEISALYFGNYYSKFHGEKDVFTLFIVFENYSTLVLRLSFK